MSFPEYFTIVQFAFKMKVHPNTVRRAIQQGKIFAFRFGTDKKGTYRIPETEIDRITKYTKDSYLMDKK